MNKISAILLCCLLTPFYSGCFDDSTGNNGDDPTPDTTPEDTGDDDSPGSGTLPDPDPTPTPEPDRLIGLTLFPASITIDTASTLTYDVEGQMYYGSVVTPEIDEWSSSDTNIATIDEYGTVTPVTTGTVEITAQSGDITSDSATLEIIEAGQLDVRVIDAYTEEALVGATVYRGLDGSDALVTDEDGWASFTGDFSGPQTVTAVAEAYHYITIQDARSRRLILPARGTDSTEEGDFSGDTDFSGMGTLDKKEIRIGIITRSFFGSPLSLDTSTIIGSNRYLHICGEKVKVPSNIVGQTPCDAAEENEEYLADLKHFKVPGPTGTYDAFMLSGDLSYGTAASWIADADTLFTNLGVLMSGIPNLNEFSYDYLTDIPIEAPDETADIQAAPQGQTSTPMKVRIPERPEGIDEEYLPMIFAIADMGERGNLPIGMDGAEFGKSSVVFYPGAEFGDRPIYALILAGKEGIGALGAYVSVMGELIPDEAEVTTPDFMALLEADYDLTDIASRAFVFTPVPDTSVQHSIFTLRYKLPESDTPDKKHKLQWDVYQPADSSTVYLPDIPEAPVIDGDLNTDWEFFAYDIGAKDFDYFTSDAELNVFDSSLMLERSSRNKITDIAEEFVEATPTP